MEANKISVMGRSDLLQLVEKQQPFVSYMWMKIASSYFGIKRIAGKLKSNPTIDEFLASGFGCTIPEYRRPPLTFREKLQRVMTAPSPMYQASISFAIVNDLNPNICTKDQEKYIRDETAWCSAFVNHVMKSCGYQGTNHLGARSWLKWGQGIDSKNPPFGAIAIFSRGTDPRQGHVGFYVGENATHYKILGGNQSKQSLVCVRHYSKKTLLEFRWPTI